MTLEVSIDDNRQILFWVGGLVENFMAGFIFIREVPKASSDRNCTDSAKDVLDTKRDYRDGNQRNNTERCSDPAMNSCNGTDYRECTSVLKSLLLSTYGNDGPKDQCHVNEKQVIRRESRPCSYQGNAYMLCRNTNKQAKTPLSKRKLEAPKEWSGDSICPDAM